MEFSHEVHGKCVIAEITQKQLEGFQRKIKGLEDEPMAVWRGTVVRAGIEGGFLAEPAMTLDAVGDAKPVLVAWIADCLLSAINEAMGISPLSSSQPQPAPKEAQG